MRDRLPIDDILPTLIAALRDTGHAVLVAPPGAGKTTRVPQALLDAGTVDGRILMLEPRRLAARAAAERIAEERGEAVGGSVGYRIRGDRKVSRETRIEIVTEGILTRMIQNDPALSGIGAVIFDEFHERSLHADLGLALVRETREVLRSDLLVVVMSATLDAAPVADLLGDAPVVVSEGRSFPVETHWLAKPQPGDARFEASASALVDKAMSETEGGVLVFLPGESEIRRVASILADRVPRECEILPLFGAMDIAAQRAAIAPALHSRRRIVLATSIAETSLTIPGIRVVVDCGRARRSRYDPGSGMARLVTERVSRAEADQRRGRAGRVAPGICYRMWTKGEEGALPAFAPPEIATADLTGLALELLLWGTASENLGFLTPPSPAALSEAKALLAALGAVNERGQITPHGRTLADLPVHPRIGHMLVTAGADAALLAALLEERDPIRGAPCDLGLRVDAVDDPARFEATHPYPVSRGVADRVRQEARRLARLTEMKPTLSLAEMAATAYPDRVGMRRDEQSGRFVLAGGKGAVIAPIDPLATADFIVATDLDGDPRQARVRIGIELPEVSLRRLFRNDIRRVETCAWSRRENRVLARSEEHLGALVLSSAPQPKPDPYALALAAFDGLRALGLSWSDTGRRYRARVELLRREGTDLPDCSDDMLLRSPDWLLPYLKGKRTASDLRALDLGPPLRARLTWDQQRIVEESAPATFETPLGRSIPIDYGSDHPTVQLRLQEVFGVNRHPTIGPRRLPLRFILLSPAQRPIQVTTDLPGFWRTSYADVRKDMRGQYPKHPWPEDPTLAEPTLRAKPRKN